MQDFFRDYGVPMDAPEEEDITSKIFLTEIENICSNSFPCNDPVGVYESVVLGTDEAYDKVINSIIIRDNVLELLKDIIDEDLSLYTYSLLSPGTLLGFLIGFRNETVHLLDSAYNDIKRVKDEC